MLTVVYRWLALLGLSLAITAAVGLKAFMAGEDNQANKDAALNAKVQAKNFTAYTNEIKLGHALGSALLIANDNAAAAYTALHQEVSLDPQTLVISPPAIAGIAPVPVFSTRAVCLWNDAWAGGTVPGGASGLSAPAGPACPAPDAAPVPSPYDLTDAIDSGIADADACWSDIRQLRSLIQYERSRKTP